MRRRNVQISFRLNTIEAMNLNKLVEMSGLSRETFLRAMISGYQLHEKPDKEFYQVMRELSAIGNRVNQLAIKANALHFIDAPLLDHELKKWNEFQMDIRKKYLSPLKAVH